MKFITRAKLMGFRCYETADVELDHVSVFVGPNNSGKSAILRAIRRLASVDLNRHPRVAERGGSGLWADATPSSLQLALGDARDGTEETLFALDVGRDLPLKSGGSCVARVCARFHQGVVRSLWLEQEGEHPPGNESDSSAAEAIVNALEALPIVVIPEGRALPAALQLQHHQDDGHFHEEVVDAGRLLPSLIDWACVDPGQLVACGGLATDLFGERVVVAADPKRSTLRIKVGADPERDVRDVGAGVVEILTLASALTLYPRALLLYEEPELHLHPRVQRRIIAKLRDLTYTRPLQVLLTTHSNHVLDHGLDEGVSTFAVARSSGVSRLEPVVPSGDRNRLHTLFDELGVRPSSGLQPQALIWVEGPSDAIYLRHLLTAVDASLVEYVDYSFAFFGGALLTHQVVSTTLVEGLIDLVGIHRNSFVVLDADRARADAPLGKDYARAFLERSDRGRLWITWGREIENYLDDETLCWAAANKSRDECAKHLTSLDRRFSIFSEQVAALRDALGRDRAHQDASDANKVKFAAKAVEHLLESGRKLLDVGDLSERLGELVAFIREVRA